MTGCVYNSKPYCCAPGTSCGSNGQCSGTV
jgi:hypothetical protein